MAAEIDCVDDSGAYVELKTNKLLASKRLVGTFERFKLFKFWVQSYLVGTPKVIVGFRDEDALRKVQAFDTLELPGLAAAWRPPSPRVAWHGSCASRVTNHEEPLRGSAAGPPLLYRGPQITWLVDVQQ